VPSSLLAGIPFNLLLKNAQVRLAGAG